VVEEDIKQDIASDYIDAQINEQLYSIFEQKTAIKEELKAKRYVK
jgi:hypothetical protein